MQKTEPITARSIRTADEALFISLADRTVRIPWDRMPDSLRRATLEARRRAELSPGGYGIHWPLIDEDLPVHALIDRGD